MRVRKVVTRRGKKSRGKFPSVKMGRMVHWESPLERDAFLHLEFHPSIVRYQEQPSVEIYYDADGIAHRYVPDLLAVFSDGTNLFIEVKPLKKLQDPEIRKKLGAVAHRFEETGRNFRVWTEEVIRREPLFSNLQTLKRETKKALARGKVGKFDRLKDGDSGWSFSEVLHEFGSVREVLTLVRAGELLADLESRLIEDTTFWTPGGEGGNRGSFRI